MHLKIKINFLSFFKDDQGLLSYAKSNNLTAFSPSTSAKNLKKSYSF